MQAALGPAVEAAVQRALGPAIAAAVQSAAAVAAATAAAGSAVLLAATTAERLAQALRLVLTPAVAELKVCAVWWAAVRRAVQRAVAARRIDADTVLTPPCSLAPWQAALARALHAFPY